MSTRKGKKPKKEQEEPTRKGIPESIKQKKRLGKKADFSDYFDLKVEVGGVGSSRKGEEARVGLPQPQGEWTTGWIYDEETQATRGTRCGQGVAHGGS